MKKIQYYEVVVRQDGSTDSYLLEAAHHDEAIKKFKTFSDEKAKMRPHYSELLYGDEKVTFKHRLK